MRKTASGNGLIIDKVAVNSLVPDNKLEGTVTIFLDGGRCPIQIKEERRTFFGKVKSTNLKPSDNPFSEEFIIRYLVSKGIPEQDYEMYIKPNITYWQNL